MFKFFLLATLAVLTLAGPAALARTSSTAHMAVSQTQKIEIALSKLKSAKITKTKKRINSSFTRRQCWSEGDLSSCKFCRPTSDGFCRCEQHFPCE